MKLTTKPIITTEQIQQYDELGFIFLPELFSKAEAAAMQREFSASLENENIEKVFEQDGKTVRSLVGVHLHNDFYRDFVRHPKILLAVQQLLGTDAYVLRTHMVCKRAFQGDAWPWHQDAYICYQEGIPASNVVKVIIFLDEVNEFNSPMNVIPGSHKQGSLDPEICASVPKTVTENADSDSDWKESFGVDLLYRVPQDIVKSAVEQGGIIAPKGAAGSVVLFNVNIFHGSTPNISPFERRNLHTTYVSVNKTPSPQSLSSEVFLTGRDYKPTQPLSESQAMNLFS
ncbi:MAG: phytanoyl-CoA dioxygenase family protein [Cyanobacteria bacterium P01_D01_bin.50]